MNGARNLALGLSFLALAGCGGGGDFADLQRYMDDVRIKPKGSIEPLPAFMPYEAFSYSAMSLRAPFQPRMNLDLAQRNKENANVRPDETRIRHFLEGFNIEDFTMVGTLTNSEGMHALIRSGDGVHRIKPGDYLGRNHGRVVDVSEAEVYVLEIAPDGEGGWVERPRSLTLKERT